MENVTIEMYNNPDTADQTIRLWRGGWTIKIIVGWTESYPSWLGPDTKSGYCERSFTVTGTEKVDSHYFQVHTGFKIPQRFDAMAFRRLIKTMKVTHNRGFFTIEAIPPQES